MIKEDYFNYLHISSSKLLQTIISVHLYNYT